MVPTSISIMWWWLVRWSWWVHELSLFKVFVVVLISLYIPSASQSSCEPLVKPLISIFAIYHALTLCWTPTIVLISSSVGGSVSLRLGIWLCLAFVYFLGHFGFVLLLHFSLVGNGIGFWFVGLMDATQQVVVLPFPFPPSLLASAWIWGKCMTWKCHHCISWGDLDSRCSLVSLLVACRPIHANQSWAPPFTISSTVGTPKHLWLECWVQMENWDP